MKNYLINNPRYHFRRGYCTRSECRRKNYESNAIVEFTPDTSINKPVDPVNPDTENLLNPLTQRHQTQAISQMKEQLVH